MARKQRMVSVTIDAPRAVDVTPTPPRGSGFDRADGSVDRWAWDSELPEDRAALDDTLPGLPAATVAGRPVVPRAARRSHQRRARDILKPIVPVLTTGLAVVLIVAFAVLAARSGGHVYEDRVPSRDDNTAAPPTASPQTTLTTLPPSTTTTATTTPPVRSSSPTHTTSPPPPPPSGPLDILPLGH